MLLEAGYWRLQEPSDYPVMQTEGEPSASFVLRPSSSKSQSPNRQAQDAEDERWLAGVAAGDHAAFVSLYRRYHAPLTMLGIRLLGRKGLAAEVVQETFARIWQDAGGYERRGRAGAWIFRIASNLCLDERRRRGARRRLIRRYVLEQAVLYTLSAPLDVPEQVWQRLWHSHLQKVLSDLPLGQRQVAELIHYGSLTVREVASILKVPEGTVKTRHRLGLAHLRLALENEGVTVDDICW